MRRLRATRASVSTQCLICVPNAQVAKILGAKVIIVTQGGIGRPIDEVCLNQALFEKEGVDIIGVIINKVIEEKLDFITEFAKRGLKRKGLELLGVLPHQQVLSSPTVDLIREELKANMLNVSGDLQNLVEDVALGAMGAHNALNLFKPGVLLITPGDREDIILAARTEACEGTEGRDDGGDCVDGKYEAVRERDENHSRDADSRFARGGGQLSCRLARSRFDREDAPRRRPKNHAHPRFDREACGRATHSE